jgi:hypothetical protein
MSRYTPEVMDKLNSYLNQWALDAKPQEQLNWIGLVNGFFAVFDPDGHYGNATGPWIKFGRNTGQWKLRRKHRMATPRLDAEPTNNEIARWYGAGKAALEQIIVERPEPWRREGGM